MALRPMLETVCPYSKMAYKSLHLETREYSIYTTVFILESQVTIFILYHRILKAD